MFLQAVHCETVCLLSNWKPDTKVWIDVDLEDYCRIKDARKDQNWKQNKSNGLLMRKSICSLFSFTGGAAYGPVRMIWKGNRLATTITENGGIHNDKKEKHQGIRTEWL